MTDETTTIEKPNESQIWNVSARFWIALIFAVGLVTVAILACFGKTMESTIFAVFSTAAVNVISTYMGQNAKPKSQQ